MLVFTAQNRQPRVQVSPSTMIVAVAMPSPSPPAPPPPFQHCAPKPTDTVKPSAQHRTPKHSSRRNRWRGSAQTRLADTIELRKSEAWVRDRTSPMLGHCASTQTVLSLSSPMDSRRRAYFSPCAARCRSHAGFFTSGSLPVYGPTGALAAVPTGGAASARHRTTETEPRGSPLPPRPAHTGGRSGRASELCIAAGGIGGARFRGLVVVWGRSGRGGDGFEASDGRGFSVAVLPLVRGRTNWMVSEGRGKMGIKY